MRIGHGYDAHRFTPGKRLIVGGIHIDFEFGLLAHSDGDVLAHALCDALFGASGLKSIGDHFPDNDIKYKNADSMMLLRAAASEVKELGFGIEYCDCTVIAEKPKFSPHIDSMRKVLADNLGIEIGRINIKATTEEKMGFTGRGEGICAHAVCLLNENAVSL